MKKLGLLVATLAMIGMTGVSAEAKTAKPKKQPLLSCNSFEFRVKGGGLQLGLGYFKLEGDGDIKNGKEYVGRFHCVNLDTNRPVDVITKVEMGSGAGIALRGAIGYFEIEGDTDLNFVGYASDLSKEYIVSAGRIAWGLGASVQTMVLDSDSLRLVLRVKPIVGAGVEVGFNSVKLTPMSITQRVRPILD